MESQERWQVGAHYTSERDILKLVRSLFLNQLRAEFVRLRDSRGTQRESRLRDFHRRLGTLTFFDPACGCGNFLVVTYRELRLLEIEVLKELYGGQSVLDISDLSVLDVDALFGIEINEFPTRIAEVAFWLVDHQMNQRLSETFGMYLVRLPFKKSADIVCANVRVHLLQVGDVQAEPFAGEQPIGQFATGARRFSSLSNRDMNANASSGVSMRWTRPLHLSSILYTPTHGSLPSRTAAIRSSTDLCDVMEELLGGDKVSGVARSAVIQAVSA
jgi:hypothetical protein